MFCTFCKKTNHLVRDCFFKRKKYNPSRLSYKFRESYKSHFDSRYSRPTRSLRKSHTLIKISKPKTEPTSQRQSLHRETESNGRENKLSDEKHDQSNQLLEEKYENISTDSDTNYKVIEDNEKTMLKLKIKRLQKKIEMQEEELKTKLKKLEKENELLKEENLSLSLLYFTEYSSDYFNTDKKCIKYDVKM